MTISVNYLSAIKAKKLGTFHTKHETYWNKKRKEKNVSQWKEKKIVVFFFFYFISFPLRHRTCSLSSLVVVVVVVVVAFVTFKRFPLSKRNLLEWIASHPDSLRERRINSEFFLFFKVMFGKTCKMAIFLLLVCCCFITRELFSVHRK